MKRDAEANKGPTRAARANKITRMARPRCFPVARGCSSCFPSVPEVTNWSQIEMRVSDKLYSLTRELTPSARYTVLRENTRRNANSRSGGARYLSTSLSISRSKSAFVNSLSIFHESRRSGRNVAKESAHDCLASINFKREISSGILKDPEKLHVDCSIVHRKYSDLNEILKVWWLF